MDFHFLLMELWPTAKAEGIPKVIRAEDAGSTENVFSYEYERGDLRVLLPSLRPGTVSPTPAFRLGLGGFKEDMRFVHSGLKPGVFSDATPRAKAIVLTILLADTC